MVAYDDKTKGAIKSGNQILIPCIDTEEDITFKASYVVSNGIVCKGKISALFDLVVLGDVTAEEIDVKGRFVCIGFCTVTGTITVQKDIWCEDLKADSVTCHGRIVAQSLDVETVTSEDSIVIGKTLAVSKKAQTSLNIICGETAYGSGRIAASCILTAEPLDLDDGEEALEEPHQYMPSTSTSGESVLPNIVAKYENSQDYSSYISDLIKTADGMTKIRLPFYKSILDDVRAACSTSISEITDTSLLIWMLEIAQCSIFTQWDIITEWTNTLLKRFRDIADGKTIGPYDPKPAEQLCEGYIVFHKMLGKGTVRTVGSMPSTDKDEQIVVVEFEKNGEKKFVLPHCLKYFSVLSENADSFHNESSEILQCNINNYSEWISALQIINQSKEMLGENLYDAINKILLSKIGLKPKYIADRFKEKGWN